MGGRFTSIYSKNVQLHVGDVELKGTVLRHARGTELSRHAAYHFIIHFVKELLPRQLM